MIAKFKMTIFTRIVAIIMILLVPTVVLFIHSNNSSSRLIQDQTNQLNLNRSVFFKEQFENGIDQMLKAMFTISNDPDSVKFQGWVIQSISYNDVAFIQSLQEKLGLQSNALIWSNQLTIYSPATGRMMSSNNRAAYPEGYFYDQSFANWTYVERTPTTERPGFVRRLVTPYNAVEDLALAQLIAEMSFSTDNISGMLDNLKAEGGSEPLLYHPDHPFIASGSADNQWLPQVRQQIDILQLEGSGYETLDIAGNPYMMIYTSIPSISWHLIDLTPMESLFQPIERSRNIFFLATGLLLILCLSAAVLVYRNVQLPISQLIRGLRRVMSGDYSARLHRAKHDEFGYLFQQYNRMAEEIHRLVEQVYYEKVKVREATVKQLQSQINPHFLYNSFAFIHSLAQLENYEGISSASKHLSEYYRYSTRTDNPIALLGEEVELLRNYLEIMKFKLHRLDYSIDIPEGMLGLPIPRLILQPVVENAVLHGVELKEGRGIIAISGEIIDSEIRIIIEDNGIGMSDTEIKQLKDRIEQFQLDEEAGCGLRNVHQRLIHMYGVGHGVVLEHSSMGGIKATVVLTKEE